MARTQTLALEIKKEFTQLSERVKSVDLHPTEPWILTSLYSGIVSIWNYQTQTMVKSFNVSESPVRSSKFIPNKHWIITGSDDKFIRVYDYISMELIKEFEAHSDYIRCLSVHPSLPCILSSSDDMLIKIWNWEKNWECTQVFEGHTHYVMQVTFNPKELNTFSSASLDGTIKTWTLDSSSPIFTLEGHSKGVNCVEYLINDEKIYLLSGSDDFTIKVWDYEIKSCIQTLERHINNVCAICIHPEFPIIFSGSEDGIICLWDAKSYRLENTLNYGLERVWTIGCKRDSHQVAFGFDKGSIMIKVDGMN